MTTRFQRYARLSAGLLLVGLAMPSDVHAQGSAGALGVLGVEMAGPTFGVGDLTGFRAQQLRYPRVRAAHGQRSGLVASRFEVAGVVDPVEVFFRVFKHDMELEVWARDRTAREFVLLVAIAAALATPIAWIVMQRWLDGFAYRISLGPGLFAATAIFALAFALLVVTGQALRAALADPVEAIRSE
jgi:hypothetical protein